MADGPVNDAPYRLLNDVEFGVVRKRTFEEWFPGEAKKVSLQWRDPKFGAEVSR